MDEQFQVDMDEFLPLRDVVFNTLRKAILTRMYASLPLRTMR